MSNKIHTTLIIVILAICMMVGILSIINFFDRQPPVLEKFRPYKPGHVTIADVMEIRRYRQ